MSQLTLPKCHVFFDVGEHGTPLSPVLRQLHQNKICNKSARVQQTCCIFNSLTTSRTPLLYHSKAHFLYQTVVSQQRPQEFKLTLPHCTHQLSSHTCQLHHSFISHIYCRGNPKHPSQKPHLHHFNSLLEFLVQCSNLTPVQQNRPH